MLEPVLSRRLRLLAKIVTLLPRQACLLTSRSNLTEFHTATQDSAHSSLYSAHTATASQASLCQHLPGARPAMQRVPVCP